MSVSETLNKVLYDGNPFKSFNKKFESVSIVANSGSLKDSGLGEEIDKSSAVIRMNSAPVEGYEEDVGSKTTIRILNALLQKGKTLDYTTTPKNWISDLKNEDVIWVPVTQRSINRGEHLLHESSNVIKLSEDFKEHIWGHCKKVMRRRPSTGLFAVILCYNFCKNIRLFGYGFHQEQLSLRHYWEEWSDSHNSSHQWDLEEEMIRLLCNDDDHIEIVDT